MPLFLQGTSFYLLLLKLLKNVQILYSDLGNLIHGVAEVPFSIHRLYVYCKAVRIHGAVDPQTAGQVFITPPDIPTVLTCPSLLLQPCHVTGQTPPRHM